MAGSSLAMGGIQSDYGFEGLATYLNAGFDCMVAAVGKSLGLWLREEETTGLNNSSTMLGPIAPFEALVSEVLPSANLTWSDGAEIMPQVPFSMIDGSQSREKVFSKPAEFSFIQKTSGALDGVPKQQSASMQDTGLLDMSAFGMDADASSGAQQEQNGISFQKPKPATQPSFEFDASAFGFGMNAPAQVEPTPSMDSGLLDPSSFGMSQDSSAQAPSSSDTGMLSAGAFGFGFEKPIQHHSVMSLDSGMLDPSAFGFDTPQSKKKVLPSDTGSLDPGAFGFGNKDSNNVEPSSHGEITKAVDENNDDQGEKTQPTERCIALKKSNIRPRSKTLHQGGELSNETSTILAKYSLSMKDEEYVDKAAQSLGLTSAELVRVCSILLNTSGCKDQEIKRLDTASKRMLTCIQVQRSMAETGSENLEQADSTTAPTDFSAPKGLPRPVSTMSMTSLATSLGTSIIAEGQGAGVDEGNKTCLFYHIECSLSSSCCLIYF